MKADEDPWDVEAWTFPHESCMRSKLEFLVRYAILAPSTHNTQPWLFQVRGEALELFADRRRALPVSDPKGRELAISCGAALALARVAAQHFGYAGLVDLQPDPRRPDLLGCIRLGAPHRPSRETEMLFAAIPKRRTTRRAFRPHVDELLRHRLVEMARENNVEAVVIDSEAARRRVASLIGQADRRQMGDPEFRRELASWIRSRSAASGDGMSGALVGVPDPLSRAGAAVIRTFDLGDVAAARDEEFIAWSPSLLLLATLGDEELNWLNVGMALGLITLRAAAADIAVSYLNQPIEVPELRPVLAQAIGARGTPQILLRLGRAEPAPAAPRRPAYKVICG